MPDASPSLPPALPKAFPSARKARSSRAAAPARALLGRLISVYLRPHLPLLLLSLVFMAVAAGTTGALAVLMKPVIDEVFRAEDTSRLREVGLLVFIVFALRGLSTYLNAVQTNAIGQRIVATAQKQLYAHLIRSDLAFLQTNASGQLLSRVINDVQVMRLAVGESLVGVSANTLTLVILTGVMFWRDWVLASVSFVAFPLAAWFVSRINRRLRRVWGQTQTEVADLSALMGQTFMAARQVKAYGTEGYEEERIGSRIQRLYALSTKSFRIANSTTPLNEVLSGLAIVTVIWYGGLQVIAGKSTAGDLLSFITAFLLAYEPIKKLSKLNGQIQAGLASAERVFAVLDSPPRLVDAPDAVDLPPAVSTVELRDVTFGYDPAHPVLRNISLTVPAGQTVALVGPSGAGKSSILNLILRFYDVDSGEVRVGGQDVRTVTGSSLRRLCALVSQETGIFDETIRANIRYGSPGATDAQVEEAAKAAQAHDFILQLPHGYDTVVGEHGTRLSGGQRQRLGIARAMLKNAPLLLLDEATSALDSESERAVQTALATLQKGRTTIAIAHRLSTIAEADVIYVMDQGRIVEAGSHSALLAKGGLYAHLWTLQGGGGSSAPDRVTPAHPSLAG